MEQQLEISSGAFSDFLNEFVQIPYGGETETIVGESAETAENAASLLGDAGMTVLIGLVVVIGTLLLLTGIFYLFGYIMSGAGKAKKAKSEEKAVAAPTPVSAPIAAPPSVQGGISAEVVAAIAAAVTMMAPEGKRYAVKSISRKDVSGRSAWAAAGIADNTRPF